MRFGIVGLGRIGGNLALQALAKGHEPVGYNRSPEDTRAYADQGVTPAFSYEELADRLDPPRVVLCYVPHGPPLEDVLGKLRAVLDPGDVVVDGGNSHWRDSRRHHAELADDGLAFVDAGTSGGVTGARHGACFMVGGEPDAVAQVAPLLRDLAVPDGYVHAGPPGAGHFVKLVHNAIEFGMVQALGEGVELLTSGEYDLDLPDVARCWANGSVIRGWLVELLEKGLREEGGVDDLSGWVEDTKEGKWYVQYALEREVPIPVLAHSEMMFYRYRDPDSVQGRVVSLIRHGFGAHPLHRKGARQEASSPERETPAR